MDCHWPPYAPKRPTDRPINTKNRTMRPPPIQGTRLSSTNMTPPSSNSAMGTVLALRLRSESTPTGTSSATVTAQPTV